MISANTWDSTSSSSVPRLDSLIAQGLAFAFLGISDCPSVDLDAFVEAVTEDSSGVVLAFWFVVDMIDT
jgi:hypothetical protein